MNSNLPINETKQLKLQNKMLELGITESDIIEKFVRSAGPGGQNVNKTSTTVYLKHLPTGIEVKCGAERSQALNRFLAKRLLADKIETLILGKRSEEQQRFEKIRRQKRKRSKRSKQKMLDNKKAVSEKKDFRRKVSL